MSQKIPFNKSKKLNFFILSSEDPQTPFAPTYKYVMSESFLDNINTSKLSKFILNLEKKIINNTSISNKSIKTVDGYTGLGSDSLTSRYESFNIFNYANEEPEILKFKKTIRKIYNNFLEYNDLLKLITKPTLIQCWANVMRKGQKIKTHIHDTGPQSYLSGHFCVQTKNTSTYYLNPINQINDPEIFESENEQGKLTIFQNSVPHYTSTYEGDAERISIAFDISLDVKTKGQQKNFVQF